MPDPITDAGLDALLAHAGIDVPAESREALKQHYAVIAAMAANVRKPRGHMAELAHIYDFRAEDL